MHKLLMAALVMVAGCLEITQEAWIDADGSGRLKITVGVHQEFLVFADDPKNPFAAFYRNKEALGPDVAKVNCTEYTRGEMRYFVYDVEIADVTTFNEIYGKVCAGTNAGPGSTETMEVSRSDNGNYVFAYVYERPASEKSTPERKEMLTHLLGERYFVTKLHAQRIVSTNGECRDGQEVVWTVPMAEMFTDENFRREFNAEVGSPR